MKATTTMQRALVTLADEIGLTCELDETGRMVIYTDLTPSPTVAAGDPITITDLVYAGNDDDDENT